MPTDQTALEFSAWELFGILSIIAVSGLLWRLRLAAMAMRCTQSKLAATQNQLLALLAVNPGAALLIDERGIIIALNKTAASGLSNNHNQTDLIGRCIYDYWPSDALERRKRHIVQALENMQAAHFIEQRDTYSISHILQPVNAVHSDQARQIAILSTDLTIQRPIAQSLQRQTALLNAVRHAQTLFTLHDAPSQVFNELLNILVRITDSQYGFLNEVCYETDGSAYQVSLALSQTSEDQGLHDLYEQRLGSGRKIFSMNNLAGAPVLERQVIIANNVTTHHLYRGNFPDGHPILNRYLGIPLFFGEELLGVVGLANHPTGYTQELVAFLHPLITTSGHLIKNMRLQQQSQALYTTMVQKDQQYQHIIENAPNGIIIIDRELYITFINRYIVSLLGYTPREMLGKPIVDFLSSEDSVYEQKMFKQRIKAQNSIYEQRFQCKNGEILWAIISATILRDANGECAGCFAILTDVSERKQIEQAFQASYSYISAVLDLVNDAVLIHDATNGQLLDVNIRACEMFGYQREEVIKLGIGDLSIGEKPYSKKMVMRKLLTAKDHGPQTFEWKLRNKSGRCLWVEMNICFAVIGGEERFITTIHDITERKNLEEELRRLSTLDALTGLLNRREFFVQAQQEYERFHRYHHPLALIMADIDYFKQINDEYGHLIGDQVLQRVAETLQNNLRQVDILGRYGGEEFVMMLPEADMQTAQALAERLRTAVAQAVIETLQGPVSVTLSLGVAAISNGHPMSLERLLDSADQMLYAAKKAGRNCVQMWDVNACPTGNLE